jgi:peptide/nickel transport system permease protein
MRFVWKRFAQLVIVLFFVTFFSFLLLALQPGDPALIKCGLGCDDAAYQATREEMGLNKPVVVQYGIWLGDILRGDLGESAVNQQPVSTELANKLPVTIELLIFSQVISLAIAIPLGVLSARKPNGAVDKASALIGFIFLATPVFVTGIILVNFFAVRLKIFPATFAPDFFEDPVGNLKSLVLPSLTLALAEVAVVSRLLRTDLMATLQEDYIMMAKAKGLSSRRIMWRHAFRPSTFSLITVVGLRIGGLIGGTIIIEQLFALNGMGRYLIESISRRDYVPLQGAVVVIAVAYVLINFAVDLFYAVLDPRIRHARSIA